MKLYGRSWTRREIETRVGRIEQIGGLRRLQWREGLEAGSEQIQVRTGSGLTFYVSPSRALDISLAEFAGSPLSWQAANGDVHPAYYDSQDIEWLRTAVGGLLMTCGLSYVGAPGSDQGQQFGLHGRVHHLPASHVSLDGHWEGDEYLMEIAGTVRETRVFGENITLSRRIRSKLGQNRLEIIDQVENAGFESTPHMILYHFNFGFPLLSQETTVQFPSNRILPRDEGVPIIGFDRWPAPDSAYQERVYYHQDMEQGPASATIFNPAFPVGAAAKPVSLKLTWSTEQLPKLVQWHMAGAGVHVLGIEPANCYVEGRAVERERGTLEFLEPGETRLYELAMEVEVSG